MSYRSLLTDRCDVYHLTQQEAGGAWGIPGSDFQDAFTYGDLPDLIDVPCYFVEKNQTIVQGDPNKEVVRSFLVHFPVETDVRVNDKVIWQGAEYKLQIPKRIKNHHIEVTAIRSDSL